MMKNFSVTIKYHLIANRQHTVTVRANTERKAEVFAVEKASKETGHEFHRMDIVNIEIVD